MAKTNYYSSFTQYRNKFARLAGMTERQPRGGPVGGVGPVMPRSTVMLQRFMNRRGPRFRRTIRKEFETLAARLVRWAENKSRAVLIKEIYQRYIPTREEYKNLGKKPDAAAFFSGIKAPRQSDFKTKRGTFAARKYAGAMRRHQVALNRAQRAYDRAVRQHQRELKTEIPKMQREFMKNPRFSGTTGTQAEERGRRIGPSGKRRAWRRYGRLLLAEKGFTEFAPGGDVLRIGLRNDAKNRKGSAYATARAELGTLGHRQNSVWTKSVWWQMEALEALRPRMMAEVSRVVQRIFETE